MAEENETIEDIIAEKRRRAEEIERDCAEKMRRGEMTSDQYARELIADIRKEADRIEVANKRERGDCAKLREAAEKTRATLEEALQILNGISDEEAGTLNARLEDVADEICEVTQWIIPDALAAPPRNCDVYNNESCRMAYHLHGDGLMTMQAFADWLYAPATATEGGAK